MEFQNILYEVDDRIATVTINRPKSLNSLNSETIVELACVFDQNALTGRDFVLAGQAAFNKIENLPKPVIAAVNGFALGGGCELAMACHLRVAVSHARFGQPEVGLGLIPGYGGTQRLPRLVGRGRALELLLGGGMIDAAEAFRIGLVNAVVETNKKDETGKEILDEKGKKVFDREDFLAKVREMLKGILAKGPLALGYVIEAVNRGLETDLPSGLRLEADLFGMACATEDSKEGLNAFLEKRQAVFKGK